MPDINHRLLIAAGPEEVYKAVTIQERLSGWWTPHTEARPELNSIARFNFGPDYYKEMKIIGLEHASLVKWLCISGAEEWIGTTISFKMVGGSPQSISQSHAELADQIQQQHSFNQSTVLIFNHDNWREYSPMFAECNYTWGRFLRSLKVFCETGAGCAWPHQHNSKI